MVALSSQIDSFRLPHSQLSQCYDNAAMVACPASGFPRQDAQYIRSRSFRIQNDGWIAKDMETGILWRRCVLGMTWDGTTCTGSAQSVDFAAAQTSCAALPPSTYGAWRVPEYRELSTLFEYHGGAPAIPAAYFPGFPGATGLWSNTTQLANPTNALANNISTGALISYAKTNTRYALCVTGPTLALETFASVQPGLVKATGLNQYWTSCPLLSGGTLDTSGNCAGPAQTMNWQTALQSCAALDGTAGLNGWRLPSVLEVLSVPDYSSSSGSMMNDSFFPNGTTSMWTASTAVYSAITDALSIRTSATPFDMQTTSKATNLPVHCVVDLL
ncbi:MAG: DUF1566 domain-containing protein [Leptospiraceae bacterium]|nr:DUF1566 domain-containing protein [Leptospiraceae bacterium]MCB1169797.1 DUF1566 domain-containing protein [Leptospiraceae bacterium]